jgi:hypothetical protein
MGIYNTKDNFIHNALAKYVNTQNTQLPSCFMCKTHKLKFTRAFLSVFHTKKPTITMTINMMSFVVQTQCNKIKLFLAHSKVTRTMVTNSTVFSDRTSCCLINRERIKSYSSHVCRQLVYRLEYKRSGGADKSLAQPRRKQATATKLGIYSTYSLQSSIQLLAHCSNFCKPLKKNLEGPF